MLWKKSWAPEAVLLLLGSCLFSLFSGNLAAEMLRHFNVPGFKTPDSIGVILTVTLCFHGAVIVLGLLALKFLGENIRDAFGLHAAHLKRNLLLALIVLCAVTPVMIGLKYISVLTLEHFGWHATDQRAVEMFSSLKSVGLRIYFGIFTVLIAPIAEEFIFRGVLVSSAIKLGWPKCGWLLTSLLFALIHNNAPVFLPLFIFALALTWLYQITGNLLAPIAAHCVFNAANLALLFLSKS